MIARPLQLPPGIPVIGVGGAVLGGAGKTPVAIALARALGGVLVGHAYRARPGRARVVGPGDAVAEVGDDALSAARLLGDETPVVVGPTRQAAVDLAAKLGRRVIVVDGLLQTSPVRLATSILVLDGTAPWGAGACPPIGDLRAPREALLAAADLIAALQPEGTEPAAGLPVGTISLPSGIPLEALRGMRLGLLLAVARPGRIVAALERAGIRPVTTILLGDHEAPSRGVLARAGRVEVEGWLTTARCATKLPEAIGGRPVLVLEHRVEVGGLVGRLAVLG